MATIVSAQVRNGKISLSEESKLTLKWLPDWFYTMTMQKWTKRTIEQNSLYRELITLIWDEIWYFPHEMHKVFKSMFLTKSESDPVFWDIIDIPSTTKLTTKEFNVYIEKIKHRCIYNWFILPDFIL